MDFLLDPLTTALVGLLTFALGVGLGHWLSLGRDRRKEWNEKIGPIRSIIVERRAEQASIVESLTFTDYDTLRALVPRRKQKRLMDALKAIDSNQPKFGPYNPNAGESACFTPGDNDAVLLAYETALSLIELKK